jgi:hypothetical protein
MTLARVATAKGLLSMRIAMNSGSVKSPFRDRARAASKPSDVRNSAADHFLLECCAG